MSSPSGAGTPPPHTGELHASEPRAGAPFVRAPVTCEPLPLAVVISGRGSNMLALARACQEQRIPARITTVIADRDAAGLTAAASLGLATARVPYAGVDRATFESALGQAIDASGAQLVVLAGFMRILSAGFVQHYPGRMLNIHPSLLPAYKGLHTHRRVLEAGDAVHGVSVHFVTAELDGGPVVMQARTTVRPGDTEDSLSARVQRLEHRIYPEVVGLVASGRLRLDASGLRLDGQPLTAPIQATVPEEDR